MIVVSTDKNGKKTKSQGGKNRVLYTAHVTMWDAKTRWGLPDEVPIDFAQVVPHISVPQFVPAQDSTS